MIINQEGYKHFDITGQPIMEGMFVGYSATHGSGAVLKFGRVKNIKMSKPRFPGDDRETHPKLGVVSIEKAWDSNRRIIFWCIQNNGKEITIACNNVIVINKDRLTKDMLNLLMVD